MSEESQLHRLNEEGEWEPIDPIDTEGYEFDWEDNPRTVATEPNTAQLQVLLGLYWEPLRLQLREVARALDAMFPAARSAAEEIVRMAPPSLLRPKENKSEINPEEIQ